MKLPSYTGFECVCRGLVLLLAAALAATPAYADQNSECPEPQYIFSWSLADNCGVKPRGGTSTGVPVTLATRASQAWQALQVPGLSKFEQDRRAILALAGDYRVSFEFLETIGYALDYERPRPYHSWATERVYVIADEGDFISLQHVMVMYYRIKDPDTGAMRTRGPVVMKHWRQDWRYQDPDLFVFRGDRRWEHEQLSADAVQGRWTQAVYQVDDAPRYEASGRWRHNRDRSIWESARTWRPLPRREAKRSDDYDVLVGVNRITVLPTGWVHGQDNEKLRLDDSGAPDHWLAREQGVDRYQRIVDFDFAAGERYWQRTAPFWAAVRGFWRKIEAGDGITRIAKAVDGKPHYAPLFDYAQRLADGEPYDATDARRFIRQTLLAYVQKAPDG